MRLRLFSALIALVLLAFATWVGGPSGLLAIALLVVMGASYEYSRLVFSAPAHSQFLTWIFMGINGMVLSVGVLSFNLLSVIFASLIVLIFVISLLAVQTEEDLAPILKFQSTAALGMVYCGVFPVFAIRLLLAHDAFIFFFGLLAIVFSGDTMAYLTGRFFGRHRLLSPVSPKKTVEGAIGGLVGSALSGGVLSYFLTGPANVYLLVGVGVLTGMAAQFGDLFESLLKRVAKVKDSGSIMPGHGGLLDRIDGVYFGAPIFYLLLNLLNFLN